ncbi:MAG: Spx/MgsR family RNA polymerase-binding regulatory protein, partial [Chitinophagaceae bacterium]
MVTVYAIPNCNTVKKAIEWLKLHAIEFQFHDYKKQGITKEKLNEWILQKDWQLLINKKGTTWKMLDVATQASIIHKDAAIGLMLEKTSIINIPVIEYNCKIFLLWFDIYY